MSEPPSSVSLRANVIYWRFPIVISRQLFIGFRNLDLTISALQLLGSYLYNLILVTSTRGVEYAASESLLESRSYLGSATYIVFCFARFSQYMDAWPYLVALERPVAYTVVCVSLSMRFGNQTIKIPHRSRQRLLNLVQLFRNCQWNTPSARWIFQ